MLGNLYLLIKWLKWAEWLRRALLTGSEIAAAEKLKDCDCGDIARCLLIKDGIEPLHNGRLTVKVVNDRVGVEGVHILAQSLGDTLVPFLMVALDFRRHIRSGGPFLLGRVPDVFDLFRVHQGMHIRCRNDLGCAFGGNRAHDHLQYIIDE